MFTFFSSLNWTIYMDSLSRGNLSYAPSNIAADGQWNKRKEEAPSQ